ncbi:alpha-2-macroglobulin family protein [Candidatus Burkholderia verschuerenii]|nr:alpha-2-macroglobulin family protein [Candidatus Burkholderia verschuerenii]
MAVSVSPDLIGTYEGAMTVRGDFVLSPNAPTTLAPGDEADVSVAVANNLSGAPDKPVPIAVTLAGGPQLQALGQATQNVMLAPMHEGVVMFRIKALSAPGAGTLTFEARYGGKTAQQRVEVSVRPATPMRTQIEFARIDSGGKRNVPGLRDMYDAYAKRVATISTTPLVLSAGLTSYLESFDHYCTEQMVSAMTPRLIAAKTMGMPTPSDDLLGKFFDRLRTRQNAQGGFGVWTATVDAEPFVSAYTMHVLLDAKERGFAPPDDLIDAGNRYLRQLASNDRLDTLDLLRQRAYAVYLLTRQGNLTTNDLAAVQKRLEAAYPKEWRTDVAAV